VSTVYPESGPLGRDLAIWEIHLKSTGKSPHTVKSYCRSVRALGAWLTEQGLSLDPEDITTVQLRSFQACLLTPEDQGDAGAKTSTVCTRDDALQLFFKFLEEEDDLPDPMRRVRRPTEEEPVIHATRVFRGGDQRISLAAWPKARTAPAPCDRPLRRYGAARRATQ